MRHGEYNNRKNIQREYERREQLMQLEDEEYLQDEAKEQLKKNNQGLSSASDDKETNNQTTTGQENTKRIETNSNSSVEANLTSGTTELTSDKDEEVEVGTKVNYLLKQTGAELFSTDTKRSYKWIVLNTDGSVRMTKITDSPSLELEAKMPGSYTIQVELMDGDKPSGIISTKNQTVNAKNGDPDEKPKANKNRPGADKNTQRTTRTKDYFDNMTAISTDSGFDGVNDWVSKTGENGETVVKSQQKDNSGIATVYYGVEIPPVEETEISGSKPNQVKTYEKTAGFVNNTIKKEETKIITINGTKIESGALLHTDGVFGAVLGTGAGTQDAGIIKDPLNDIGKIVEAAKKEGNIKEIEITMVGVERSDWTPDQKEHYEYDLAAAKTNLLSAFQKEAGKRILIKFNPNKIELSDSSSPKTIIKFR
jgi:hypothetical protein